MADQLAQPEIFAVRIGHQPRSFQIETPRGGINVAVIDQHVDDLRQKHVVRPERQDLPHAALDDDGRLLQRRSRHDRAAQGRESRLAEFVVVTTRTDAAPVDGTRHGSRGEVDRELARARDQRMGVAFGTHRDVTHRRCGADRPRPRHGQQVPVVGRIAAPHQHGRQRIDHRAGFPTLFHRPSGAACERPHGKDTLFNRNSYPAGGGTA